MRKIICFLLVLAMCLSLSCTAFAAAISPGESAPSVPDAPDSDVPDTGDNAELGTWLLVMIVALVFLVAVTVCYFKFVKK